MTTTINTNIASLTAQRNLAGSAGALNTSLERLSSGLRINSARDDAAGLAISERFTSQIRGLEQAARNANDGISLAQTAEGALSEISNNLQRIRELSVQSANATNSSSDRAALQAEVGELLEEIDRVAEETDFNGVSLLDGSFDSQLFQVGANSGQTISIDEINSARTSTLGQTVEASVSGTFDPAGNVSGLTINGETVADSANAGELADNIEAVTTGVQVEVTNAVDTQTLSAVGGTAEATSFELNGTTIDLGTLAANTSAADVASAAAQAIEAAGIANISATSNGADLIITGENGANIEIASSTGAAAPADGVVGGDIEITSANAIEVGGTVTNSGLTAATTLASTSGTFLTDVNISSVEGATAAIDSVDASLDSINASRAELGAIQNRFESVVTSLQITSDNLSDSRSRIQDADFAAETAELTRATILQQAGTTVLAQANALPNNVLALLG